MRVGLAYVVGAWVILQIVDFGLDAISAPNWIMQMFILLAAVGFPVVLIVAWVFELTPEGIRRESEIDRTQSISAPTGRRLDRVIIAFLAVAVVLLFGERFFVSPDDTVTVVTGDTDAVVTAASRNTIAVLPFVNMSSDEEQEYFSDGITEEILNRLAGIRELQVAARTSVFSFKGQSALGGRIYPGDQVEDGGLACSVGADQTVDSARLNAEIEAMYRTQSPKKMGHVLYFKQRGHHLAPSGCVTVLFMSFLASHQPNQALQNQKGIDASHHIVQHDA